MATTETPPKLEFIFAAHVTVDTPLDLGDVAKGGCDERGVAVFEGGFKIGGDGFGTAEILGGVPEGGLGLQS